jgi:hypothetical protein
MRCGHSGPFKFRELWHLRGWTKICPDEPTAFLAWISVKLYLFLEAAFLRFIGRIDTVSLGIVFPPVVNAT